MEARVARLVLPWPPTVNHYYRRVGARTLISRDGRTFRIRVGRICAASRIRTATGPVSVSIIAHPPDRRRRDLDNALKAILDALEHGGALVNDSQVERLEIERAAVVPGGKVIVSISER